MDFSLAMDMPMDYEEKLGEGAHAKVVKANSTEYGKIALKIFKDKEIFSRELEHYKVLPHDPRWPSCYAAGDIDGSPSLVLSYENIVPLHRFTMDGKAAIVDDIGPADMLDYIIRCVSTIADMHKATGRAHNDLHYQNFGLGYSFKDEKARAVIFDFGLSDKMDNPYDFAWDTEFLLFHSKALIRRKATKLGGEWLDLWTLLNESHNAVQRLSEIYGINSARAICDIMTSDGADMLKSSALDEYARDIFDTSLVRKLAKGVAVICKAVHIPAWQVEWALPRRERQQGDNRCVA